MRVATLPVPSFQAAVNHLLSRESWARAQLVPYAGRRARLHMTPFTFDVMVAEDGYLAVPSTLRDAMPAARAWRDAASAASDADPAAGRAKAMAQDLAAAGTGAAARDPLRLDPADVEITVLADAVPALLRHGPSVLMAHVRIEGDAEFAQALGRLAEHLRWEPEEDLAQWIGDVPAYRVVRGVRQAGAQLRRLADGAVGQLAEYLLDERPQLVRTRVHDGFGADIAAVSQRVQTLEARIARLEHRNKAGGAQASAAPPNRNQTGAPQ